MALLDDLKQEVKGIFRDQWSIRDGNVVPDTDDLKLTNDGVKISATVLYADLADSTGLVETKKAPLAAEIYKAFLRCACKIISANSGTITAFDGDRVMGVFIGDSKNTSATKAALKINWAVHNIVNPCLKEQYPDTDYVVRHSTGIDTSDLMAARTGIRGSNDLVWVGPAANYAAKLCSLRTGDYNTWISKKIFENIAKEAKYSGDRLMWEARTWTKYNQTVYCSSFWWGL